MMDEIRKEIKNIEASTLRLKDLAADNPAVRKNAEMILVYLYLLKFITPEAEEIMERRKGDNEEIIDNIRG